MSQAEQISYDQDGRESENRQEQRAQQESSLDELIYFRFRDEPTDEFEAQKAFSGMFVVAGSIYWILSLFHQSDEWTPTLVFFKFLEIGFLLLLSLITLFCKVETMRAISLKVHELRMAIKKFCPRVLSDNIHYLLIGCREIYALHLLLIVLGLLVDGFKEIIKSFSGTKVVDVIEPVVDIAATNATQVQLSE